MPSPFAAVRRLSNPELLRCLHDLTRQGRALEVQLLVHIAEVDRRKLFLKEGYPSLFRYLAEGLRMSEQAAYNRMRVARAAREFPAILARIRSGELHLTGAKLLAAHLSEQNCLELLERAKHKTTRQIEALVADLNPLPPAPDLVLGLPQRSIPELPRPSPAPATAAGAARAAADDSAMRVRPSLGSTDRRPTPLGRELFKVQFTADQQFVEVLEEVQSLMRHQVPDGNLSAVFGRALRLLREELKRVKFGQTERPRRASGKNGRRSRHVPNATRRAVAERDEESCAYVSPNGRRCGSKDFLEFEHQDAWAKNGVHRAGRIRMFCRPHNQLAAEEEFGREHMEQFTRGRRPGGLKAEGESQL